MKYTHVIALFVALTLNGILCTDSVANPSTCEELVTECFVAAPEVRDGCIQTASATAECERSSIHTLVSKRAQFAPIKDLPHDGPAFLGPQIVDQRCLAQFDTRWSAALVNGTFSRESLSSLSAALDQCAKAEVPALPHL
jgi:hypothetical protein